jgi:ComF family protein
LQAAQRCSGCQRRRFHFRGVVALGGYHEELREAVLRMKRYTGEALGMALGELLWRERGQQILAWQPSIVVPVSMHWTRRVIRQTNSAEVLAEVLGKRLGVPVRRLLLRRTRRTRPQVGLSASRRRTNMRGAFAVRRWHGCRDARALLVDDVLTTGSTCSEAARALVKAGANGVFVAVLARGEGED